MIHGIGEEEVLEKSENAVSIKVKVCAASDYFDGHFPEFKLLPAVAQIDLLVHYAQKYFGLPLSAPKIKRFKFSGKILPDTDVIFKINYDSEKGRVTFEVLDAADGKSYSSGNYGVRS